MAKKKGDPKTGGRQKGSVNKINSDVRQFVLDIAGKFQQDPKKCLEAVDAEVFWSKIFPKIIPKDVNIKLQAWVRTLSDTELDEQIKRLSSEIDTQK